MNIKNLAERLEQYNIEFELIEKSPNYPVLKFNIESNTYIVFYRENFIKRSKFHKKYNVYLEIEVMGNSDISFLESEINKMFSCQYCLDKNKLYANISKVDENKIIDFINKLKK